MKIFTIFCLLGFYMFPFNYLFSDQMNGPWLVLENTGVCSTPNLDCKDKGIIPKGMQVIGTQSPTEGNLKEIYYFRKSWIDKRKLTYLSLVSLPGREKRRELKIRPYALVSIEILFNLKIDGKEYNQFTITKNTENRNFRFAVNDLTFFEYEPIDTEEKWISYQSFELSGIADFNKDKSDDFIIKEGFNEGSSVVYDNGRFYSTLSTYVLFLSSKNGYERINMIGVAANILNLSNKFAFDFYYDQPSLFNSEKDCFSLKYINQAEQKDGIVDIYLKDLEKIVEERQTKSGNKKTSCFLFFCF